MDQATLNRVMIEAQKNDFQIWIHALGNRAQDMALEPYELAQREAPRTDARNRIEHAGNQERGGHKSRATRSHEAAGHYPCPNRARGFIWAGLSREHKPTVLSFTAHYWIKAFGLRGIRIPWVRCRNR